MSDAKRVFEQIYDRRSWGTDNPRSGPGSDPVTARPYVDFVLDFVASERIEQVVDLGCGDWAMWPPHAFEQVHYTGIDIVDSEIDKLSAALESEHRRFVADDVLASPLPPADVALCKDVLIHLSDDDVSRLLSRLRPYPWVIVSHDIWAPSGVRGWKKRVRNEFAPRVRWRDARNGRFYLRRPITRENCDIQTGGFRPLDLCKPPWSMEDFGFRVLRTVDFTAGPSALPKRIWLLERIA